MNSPFGNINKEIREQFVQIQKSLSESVRPFLEYQNLTKETFKKIALAIEELPNSIKALSKYGWFVNFNFTPGEINTLGKYLDEGQIDNVNKYMTDYVLNNLDHIEKEVSSKFEHRVEPIKEALSAHQSGKWYLSTPVILSQTEGIFKEFTGLQIYRSKNKEPVTAEWVKSFESNSILNAFLEPLGAKESIRKHKSDEFIGFTRNDVLHGENFKYGTEVNSAKAICFMYYVVNLTSIISKK